MQYLHPPDRTAADDKHCLSCVYHCIIDNIVACEYILVTDRRRGCQAGLGCLRYVKGDHRRRAELLDRYGHPRPRGEPKVYSQPKKPICMVKMSLAAYQRLKEDVGISVAARALGCTYQTLHLAKRQGRINADKAARILELYGIDVIDHTP